MMVKHKSREMSFHVTARTGDFLYSCFGHVRLRNIFVEYLYVCEYLHRD